MKYRFFTAAFLALAPAVLLAQSDGIATFKARQPH
jgi:hypothetical protein